MKKKYLEFLSRNVPHSLKERSPKGIPDISFSSINFEKIIFKAIEGRCFELFLRCKKYLKLVYSLSDEKCQAYSPDEKVSEEDFIIILFYFHIVSFSFSFCSFCSFFFFFQFFCIQMEFCFNIFWIIFFIIFCYFRYFLISILFCFFTFLFTFLFLN